MRSFYLTAVVLVLGFVVATEARGGERRKGVPMKSSAFTELALDDGQGTSKKLADYHGQVVLLDFWATWCVPCAQSLPHYNELQRELGKDGFVVLAVSIDEERKGVAEHLTKLAPDVTLLYDTEHKAAKTLDLPGMPTSFLIGRNGKPVKRFVGFRKKETKVLREAIEVALAPPAEVSRHLSGLHTAQKAYYAEMDHYSNDLSELGFELGAEVTPWSVGFCGEKASHTAWTSSSMNRSPCDALEELDAELAKTFTSSKDGFRAFAIGNFDSDTDIELWSVDQTGTIRHHHSD